MLLLAVEEVKGLGAQIKSFSIDSGLDGIKKGQDDMVNLKEAAMFFSGVPVATENNLDEKTANELYKEAVGDALNAMETFPKLD